MNCKGCCNQKTGVSESLEQYIRSQVRRKANKAYKLKELEEKAQETEFNYKVECNRAASQYTELISKQFPHLLKYIRITHSVGNNTPEWKAYYDAKDKCNANIHDEIDRIMAAAQAGKTYDEIVEMVKSLTFNTDEY